VKIELWPTDRPKPYKQNPRFNDDAVEAVARSIREFGFRQPIVVDEAGLIIVATPASRPRCGWVSTRCPCTWPAT
jgi:hypothetical protein